MVTLKKFLKKVFITINVNASPSFRRYFAKKTGNFLSPRHTLFRGIKFKVEASPGKHFYMIHFGGTIEKETFSNGLFETWEHDTGWIWKELCCSSEVIFDIGANTGIYSLTAKALNPKAGVYAFEPSKHIFNRLLENSNANNFNIHCKQLAVSNQTGNQVLFDLPYASDNASLSPEKMKNWEGYNGAIIEYEVKTITLSDYIEENSIGKIDLIKIDVELHEPEVIEGLGQYLLKFQPIIIFEMLTADVAQKLKQQINLNEFRLFHLKNNNSAVELDDFKFKNDTQNSREWNYLLFHKDLNDKMKASTSLFD